MNKRFYLLLLVGLTLLTFGKILTFTFWKDDWQLLWSAIYNIQVMHQYWVHPGSVVEFMWLTKIFGANPVWWHIVGLILHVGVAAALYVFAEELAGSRFVGFVSGIFYATTVIGMDAIGWPSAHVVLISGVLLLTGMTYFLQYLREEKSKWLILTVLYLGIGLISDPFRNFPVFFMLPLVIFIVKFTKRQYAKFLRFLEISLLTFVTMAIFGFGVFAKDILGSQLFKHILALKSPVDILKKVYVVGNYFNSLANLMVGWFARFPEEASIGVYNGLVARLGFFVFCVVGGVGYQYIKTKSKVLGIILFLFLWIALFYIPNWLFEPRLTLGVTHRYMTLSGLGFVILIAYMISLLKDRTLQMLVAAAFIILNMGTAKYYLSIADTYRSSNRIQSLWSEINASVLTKDNLIFIFDGEDPLKTYGLMLSGPAPFGLMRKVTDVYNLPIVSEDRSLIQKLLCSDNVQRVEPGRVTVQKKAIPLNHVFAWNVTNTGKVTNISLPTRKSLLISAMDAGCVPLID